MQLRTTMLSAAVVVAATSACTGVDQGSDASGTSSPFSFQDSAGIQIAVTDGAHAQSPIGWQVSDSPQVRLGSSGLDPALFFAATAVRQLPNGTIVVLDGGENALKFFDASGALELRTGRRGSGPGEFQYPVLVPSAGHDSLLIWDVRLVRLHVYSDRGQHRRQSRPLSWVGGRPPKGITGTLALVDYSPNPFPMGATDSRPGVWESPRVYVWIDLATGERTPVDTIVDRYYRDVGPGGVPVIDEIPFTSASSAVVRGAEAWLTRGDAALIQVHNAIGNLVRSIRVSDLRRPVLAADVRGVLDALTESSSKPRDYWEQAYSARPLPDSMATFVSLIVDDDGPVWAKLYEWNTGLATTWIVFESNGHARGSIRTPAGLVVHQVGRDFILGVRRDSDGIDWIERYGLTRE